MNSFLIPGPAGKLEVMTTSPDTDPKGIAIICHPDPKQQGTMNNKVVTIAARAFMDLGLATVRFNFRGVGQSTGEYGHTVGELDDLMTVIEWAQQKFPKQPLWLAGFSFGSYISAMAAKKVQPYRLISIAPPVNFYDFDQFQGIQCPWLVIIGDADELVPLDQIKAWAAHPPSPLDLIVMEGGVSHFFHGRLMELRDHIEHWSTKKSSKPQ